MADKNSKSNKLSSWINSNQDVIKINSYGNEYTNPPKTGITHPLITSSSSSAAPLPPPPASNNQQPIIQNNHSEQSKKKIKAKNNIIPPPRGTSTTPPPDSINQHLNSQNCNSDQPKPFISNHIKAKNKIIPPQRETSAKVRIENPGKNIKVKVPLRGESNSKAIKIKPTIDTSHGSQQDSDTSIQIGSAAENRTSLTNSFLCTNNDGRKSTSNSSTPRRRVLLNPVDLGILPIEEDMHFSRTNSINKKSSRSPTNPFTEHQSLAGSPAFSSISTKIGRKRSLVKLERKPVAVVETAEAYVRKKNILKDSTGFFHPWRWFSKALTCWLPGIVLNKIGGMANASVQQAWREKVGLVFIACSLMAALGFLTFAFNNAVCKADMDGWQKTKWSDLEVQGANKVVFNGLVLNLTKFLNEPYDFGPYSDYNLVKTILLNNMGKDVTMAFTASPNLRIVADLLVASFNIGAVEEQTFGCLMADVILYISLIMILSLIVIKFALAIFFQWFISHKLGKLRDERSTKLNKTKTAIALLNNEQEQIEYVQNTSEYTEEVYTVLLVTCYSEDQEGIRTTMNSLADTIYSDSKKLLFVVADGIVTGSGQTKSTPDLILEMLELDPNFTAEPKVFESIAVGPKRVNMGRVYTGYYSFNGHRVPTILVAKCGTPAEQTASKPGNRGKRDSQIILMNFFKAVTLDLPMTEMEFDLFTKMHYLMKVTPDRFEIILMVDADTRVMPDSLSRMVACMVADPLVMGLCGETRIMNKAESWVSRIQVFEYYLSHHLNKTFESIFGGVTCLPGCFCMWRIKAPTKDGYWVPILANPDICATYSESVVDTLHKKNLLLLGEDRFLTTIMLGTFPRRKTLFVPRAFCKTTVPNSFAILLSQRRRWINSTIHNLMELVLVRELCGVFCFSMQFVIFLELVGTVTLPAAISFTIYLCIISIIGPDVPVIPLALLAAILGLPAVLILLTTKRVSYVYWLFVYLFALPIWNFVLPAYAFWHFDDFSWGETRKVEGEKVDKSGHGDDGENGKEVVIEKRAWIDWERERRRVDGFQIRQKIAENNRNEFDAFGVEALEVKQRELEIVINFQNARSPLKEKIL